MNIDHKCKGKIDYFCKVQTFEQYSDYQFVDDDPCHLYCVSHDSELDSWYGILYSSETEDGDFEHEEGMLSPDLVSKLVGMIPKDELPV